jgi:hypothetical protein
MSLAFALVVNTPRECLLHYSITVQFYTTENATEEGNRQEETRAWAWIRFALKFCNIAV